jgi:MFS family permease
MFLYAVVVPVFPFSLVSRLKVPESEVQHWVSVLLAAYGAALLVGAPIFGFYADQVEHRRTPLLLGLLAIAGSTLMICLAKSLAILIIGRILQGFSASVIWVKRFSTVFEWSVANLLLGRRPRNAGGYSR